MIRKSIFGAIVAVTVSSTASAQYCGCVGDLNNDGAVAGADITFLLTAWGDDGFYADLNADGVVSGLDITILLAAWGPCPVVANDACAGAVSIEEGTFAFCTGLATTEGPELPEGTCEGATQVFNDIWFAYEAPSNGFLTLSTCDTATFDTVIAVYSSVIPGLSVCPSPGPGLATYIGCADDDIDCALAVSTNLTVPVIGGNIYKIRLGGYDANDKGAGHLTLDFSNPGSSCEDSIVAPNTQGIIISGSTADNPIAVLPPNCFSGLPPGPAEWITVENFCPGYIEVSTCLPGTNFDTVITVLRNDSGSDCWETFIECIDDTEEAGCELNGFFRKSHLEFIVGINSQYRIVVSGYNGASGNYQLQIFRWCH